MSDTILEAAAILRRFGDISAHESLKIKNAKYADKYDGKSIKLSKSEYDEIHKDYKGSNPKKPTILVLTNKGTTLVPVTFS